MNQSDPTMRPPPADLQALQTRLEQQDYDLQTLRTNVEYLRSALEISDVSLWEWDIRSGAVSRPFRLAPRDDLGSYSFGATYTEFMQAIHADDRPRVQQAFDRALREDVLVEIEYRVAARDGSIRWREAKGRVFRDEAGKPLRMRGVSRDITKRKAAEQAVHDSEERFRQLAENIGEVMWMSDCELNRQLYISPAYEAIWGRSRASLYENPRSFIDAVHPEDRARVVAFVQDQRQRAAALEYRIIRPDGTVRWVRDRGVPIRDAAGRVYRVTGIASDITRLKAAEDALRRAHDSLEQEVAKRTTELSQTNAQLQEEIRERRRTEEALRRAEAKYRSIFENATEGIYQTTPDGRYLSANPALARIDGFDSAEQLLAEITNIGNQLYVDPRRRSAFVQLLETQGAVRDFEAQIRRRDGRVIWVSENARAVRDAAGKLLYFEGTVRDITERKHLEDQLRQAQKMEALGRLAGGVAHDFNNLLTGIIGYADLLMSGRGADDPMYEDLAQIKRAGERAAALTSQLLAFSRRQILDPRVLDLNTVVADMEKMLRRLLGEDIELFTRLAPNLDRVRADPGQIEQVILNLAVNARDAMPQGGRLTLSTAMAIPDEALLRAHPEMHRGPHVLLTVSDTGCGMDEPTRTRLFEPFFTTKEIGKGTGLGLATIYGIVKQSEGQITVESAPGRGTTFRIYLPRHEEAPRKARRTAPSFQLPTGSETILLVEDEELVRNLAQMVLQHQGYQVLVAGLGPEALRLGTQHAGAIDLLVADVVMPGMSGRQLAQELLRTRPKMKVLYLSGYTQDAVGRHGVFEDQTALLHKPFSPDELAQKVRDVLDSEE
jgi:two-component system cell cycle sensor histidine kinase/response regulator CckA